VEKILQLKISLKSFRPTIWRRVLVEDSINFYELHNIIQIVMGWEDSHLFEFDQGGLSIGMPHDDYGDEVQNSKKIRLSNIFTTEKQRLNYIYDFGDGWEHSIFVEKILDKEDNKKYPVCTAGKMACPPEDVGGVWGYEEILEVKKDKNHPEYEEQIIDWLGEDFDSEKFDIDDVNTRL